MKVAIIAPVELIERYCTTDVQYCIPRLLVDSDKYTEFYKQKRQDGNYVMLDIRKPGWRRQPEDYDIIKKALSLLTPTVTIYPSVMYNAQKTIEVAMQFIELFGSKLVGAVCLEGTTIEEVESCRESIRPIYTYALPSHIFSTTTSVRCEQPLIYIENHLKIEELDGLSGFLATSLPIRLGLLGRLVADYMPSPPSLDFFIKEDPFPKVVERNIKDTIEYYSK